MSVINVAFEPDSVRLFTDTMVYSADGNPGYLCRTKTHLPLSRRFAWTCRGDVGLGEIVTGYFLPESTFDDAHAILAQLPTPYAELEITLAGWSDKEGRLIVARRLWNGERHDFHTLPHGLDLKPMPGPSFTPPSTATDEQMIKLAMAQHAVSQRFDLKMCLGGVLHRTLITKDGASQSIVGTYPDYAEHAERFGCPNEHLVRALSRPVAVAAVAA